MRCFGRVATARVYGWGYRIPVMVACQAPCGAATSTVSPSLWPSSAAPSGEVGETVPEPPTALTSTVIVRPLPSTSTTEPMPTCVGSGLGDDLGAVEAGAQCANPRLEQALLVLRCVVLEVLGEVAELAGLGDRLHDLAAARAFELGQLRPQRFGLAFREAFAAYHFDRPPRRREV